VSKSGGGGPKIFLRIFVSGWKSTEYFFGLVRVCELSFSTAVAIEGSDYDDDDEVNLYHQPV